MSAPILDRPETTPSTSSTVRRRRRPVLLLVATALVVVAASVGASLALADRSSRQPALAPATPAVAPADQAAGQDTAADRNPGSPATAADRNPGSPQPAGAGGGGEATPVLPDGRSDAYIKRVDPARNRLVVDVVQVFHDRAAVQAAIADGKSPSEARYFTTWVRNQNPRLRTLPMADGLRVDLRGGCEEPAGGPTVLDRLAANARSGAYYYTLTVSDGTVQRIQEHLAINAC